MRYPTDKNEIISKFGYRKMSNKQDYHGGVDYVPIQKGVKGDPVHVIANGKVKHIGNDVDGWGRYVVVEHIEHCTLYCHLDQINVEDEQTVDEGHIIGLMGTTGHSTGVHLHFEVRKCHYSDFWVRWEDITSDGNREFVHSIDPELFFLRFLDLEESTDVIELVKENIEMKTTLDNINKLSERN